MRPPKYGYEVTFDVDGSPMLICCVADNADDAIRVAREIVGPVGYGDCPVIKIELIP